MTKNYISEESRLQEWLFSLPREQLYALQTNRGAGWETEVSFEYLRLVPLEVAAALFQLHSGQVRIVKYSRYLANGQLVIHSILRHKESMS